MSSEGTSAIPRYGLQKYLIKRTEFFTLTRILLQFHEMLQLKGACSNSPIYWQLLFYDIYVANSSCDSLRYH